MSARLMLLRGMLLGSVLLLVVQPAHATLWTTPDPVVAGQPARIVFSTWSYGGRPQVEVEVDGQQIVLTQGNLCAEDICFSAKIPAWAEATLPALDAGTYTVVVVRDGVDDPPPAVATLDVVAGGAVRVVPAEGFWAPVGQPGSGLFVERRGGLLAVSTYSFRLPDGEPVWLLGVGSYAGDSVPLLMDPYADGDCLGCTDHQVPVQRSSSALQLRFESARRAWLDIGPTGSAPAVPVISLPFGAAYIPHALNDSVDDAFGSLPLPDLRGRWMFAIEGAADTPSQTRSIRLDQWTLEGDAIRFTGNEDVVCRSATQDQRAGCTFLGSIVLDPPPPEPIHSFLSHGWFVPLGDLEEDRMRGVFEADGQTWRVQGFRTDPPPLDPGH